MDSKKRKHSELELEQPERGYLSLEKIKSGVLSVRRYMRAAKAVKDARVKRKDLLAAGEKDSLGQLNFFVEVVFKNIPSNSKTYIHNVVLPHHWRATLEPEEYDIALFVKHRKPQTEAQKIQFKKDRELDIENTHSYYTDLFQEKLDDVKRSKISRIITTKELATEFNTFQKLDRLSKTYDLFLSDKPLMANKMNALPRRLGKRFWVREKKVPIMINLSAKDLDDQFDRALSTEPFYVIGRSTTERIQVGQLNQPDEHIIANVQIFLDRLYKLYGDGVRFIRFRTNLGKPLTTFADLSLNCPKVVMKKKRTKLQPVVGDFDFFEDDRQVKVYPNGSVRVLQKKK